jgi:hypothetical protein
MSTEYDTIDFGAKVGLVGLDADAVLAHIKEALVIGSKREQLSWSDFTFQCNSGFTLTAKSSFEELVDGGVPYLDALVITECDIADGEIEITPRDAVSDVIVNYLNISRGIFAWYFSLYSQARAVGAGSNNFLLNVLNLGANWPNLINSLTSANIENFPKSWVKNVDMNSLDEAARNRLALGAAGQRYLQALNYIEDTDFAAGKVQEKQYINGLKNWTKGKVYWDLHPLFKSGNVITITKSLNKSIEDCLYSGLTDTGKSKLVNAKIIFKMPVQQPAHSQWRSMSLTSLPNLTKPIFQED